MSVLRSTSRRIVVFPVASRPNYARTFAILSRGSVHQRHQPFSRVFSGLGLSCFLLALPAAAALSDPAEVVEPATKISFSKSLDELPLVGTGCRYKWGMVKVYAVGIYSATATASGGLEGIVSSSEKKAIVIKMARSLDSQKLVDALDDAFKPRLALPGRTDANMPLFMKVVQEAAGGQCDEGDEFVFTISGADTMTITATKAKQGGTTVQGKQAIVDADIAFALTDTYLGATLPEVAPSLTSDIKKTLGI